MRVLPVALTVSFLAANTEDARSLNIVKNRDENETNITKALSAVKSSITSEKIQENKLLRNHPGNPVYSIHYDDYPVNSKVYSIILKFLGAVLFFIVLGFAALVAKHKYKLFKQIKAIKGNPHEPRPFWTFSTPRVPKACSAGWTKEIQGSAISYVNSRTIRSVALKKQFGITAAVYNMGLSSGKHVFACMWPRNQKYANNGHISIGLGQNCAETYMEFVEYLLGSTKNSLGFDLLKNCLYLDGKKIETYPRGISKDYIVPTLFYMYVDMDQHKLWFASETEFWGLALNFEKLCTNRATLLYPMVACRGVEGKFMLFYKGEVSPPELENTCLQSAVSTPKERYHDDILERIKLELGQASEQSKLKEHHFSSNKSHTQIVEAPLVHHNPAFDFSENSQPSTSGEKNTKNRKYSSERRDCETSQLGSKSNNSKSVKEEMIEVAVISTPSCFREHNTGFISEGNDGLNSTGVTEDVGELTGGRTNQGFSDDNGRFISCHL